LRHELRKEQILLNDSIIVTAATGGIGSEVAKALAKKGQNLVLAGRNKDKAEGMFTELLELGSPDVRFKHLDFDHLDSIEAFAEEFECIKGLVVCPPRIKPTADPLPDQSTWLYEYNRVFLNPLELIKCLIPAMKAGAQINEFGRSSAVLISGISSRQAMSNYAINNSLRAGWQAQIKTLANAFGPIGIAFNSISLGGVLTETYKSKLNQKAQDAGKTIQEQMDLEVGNVPLRRYAEPQEVGSVVAETILTMSKHITGQNIIMDGGFVQAY